MIITQLYLSNFMGHKERTFDFTPGTNLISGRNGIGKSSLILAIGVALFNYNYMPLGKMLRFGETQAKIIIKFTHNDREYKVTRIFGKSSDVVLVTPEKKIYGSTQVYDTIKELLGDNISDVFRDSMCIRSSNLTAFFLLETSMRKKAFDSLLGFDDLENAWTALAKTKSETLKTANLLEARIKSKYNDLETEKDQDFIKLIASNLNKKMDTRNSLLNEQTKLETEQELNRLKERETQAKRGVLLDAMHETQTELKNKTQELTKLTEQLQQYHSELEIARENRCPVCNSSIIADDLILEYENKIKESKARIDTQDIYYINLKALYIGKDLSQLTIDEEYKRIELELKKVNADLVNIEKEVLAYTQQLKDRTSLIYQKMKLQESKEKDTHDLDFLNAKLDLITRIRETLRSAVEFIRKRTISNTNSEASLILSALLENNVDVSVNKDYEVHVTFADRMMAFLQLSEGQKVMTALSIRLALLKEVTNLGIVFLDEPTINLDTQSTENLREHLYDLGFNQMFLITHDSTFENKVDNIVRI